MCLQKILNLIIALLETLMCLFFQPVRLLGALRMFLLRFQKKEDKKGE